jgi:hypothetical protein
MTTWFAAFCASFLHVSLRAFQQLNVQHDRFRWVLPCSLLMGLTEVAGVLLIVQSESFLIFLPLGCGGAAGCWLAMFVHKELRRELSDSGNNPACAHDTRGIEIDGDLGNEWR